MMKLNISIFGFLLVLGGFSFLGLGCGDPKIQTPDPTTPDQPVTEKLMPSLKGQFVSQTVGAAVNQTKVNETLDIQADGSFVLKVRRDASAGGVASVSALCGYVLTGQIERVYQRSDDSRRRYAYYATHKMDVTYSSVALTGDLDPDAVKPGQKTLDSANTTCVDFQKKFSDQIPTGNFKFYAEVLDGAIRLHMYGGQDYILGGPRTASVNDECFRLESSDPSVCNL